MKREWNCIEPLSMKMLSVLFLSTCRYQVNRYKSEDRTSIEPTSKPFGGEVKVRALMHEIELTHFV